MFRGAERKRKTKEEYIEISAKGERKTEKSEKGWRKDEDMVEITYCVGAAGTFKTSSSKSLCC